MTHSRRINQMAQRRMPFLHKESVVLRDLEMTGLQRMSLSFPIDCLEIHSPLSGPKACVPLTETHLLPAHPGVIELYTAGERGQMSALPPPPQQVLLFLH